MIVLRASGRRARLTSLSRTLIGGTPLRGDSLSRLVEDLGCDELARRYAAPTGRTLATMAIERVVHADKA